MKATVFISPNGRTEVIEVTNVYPEDAAYFVENNIHISMEQLAGETIVYADIGQTDDEGEPVELIEFAGTRSCEDTLAALRKACEEGGMSKEVKWRDELKALAEGMDGWPNKAAFQCDDVWFVGAIDEDENLYPVIEIQTEQYDAFDASEPMAKYYAAANPPAILELLAERDALLAERDALRAFANELVSGAFEGGSFDGGDIQDMGVKHGLLRIEQRDEECGEACACREYGFPSECYRKTELLGFAALQGEQP